ncbi:hypothetical protein Ctha_0082 [Chloroherpeton thalassium ATCC 35110]|uniref:Lipoprotein n=1 Tax=Chloroherpeton thalassium (strain ATCC 35110 / GB-78) TaxID=517418 RepID=B3QSG2_CHLT3|nr:hypothetical protein [Chloroherpeton thalassium]ACF12553.1 hypothetical protein Ctha_0082 [Chloroherpeton thalassium ATCC 35110]
MNRNKFLQIAMRWRQAAVVLLLFWLAAGCSVGTDEEDISNSSDGEITETDATGNVVDEDSNDWRIQNYFKNNVYIKPAYPNPTSNGIVTITMTFIANIPESGVYIYANNINSVGVFLYQLPDVSYGAKTFSFSLVGLSPSSSLTQIQGKQFRLRIYDGMGRLISFGDVEIAE